MMERGLIVAQPELWNVDLGVLLPEGKILCPIFLPAAIIG